MEKVLSVFDIDETLFRTKSHVKIVDIHKNEVIKVLQNKKFNQYSLKDNEKFDFSEFRNANIFYDTAKPIEKMLNLVKKTFKTQNIKSRIIFLTARGDFDNKTLFLQKFKEHDIPIDNIYVERAGNLAEKFNVNARTHVTKAAILRKYIKSKQYNKIQIWDDHKENLDFVLKLKEIHPEIEIITYLVDKNGEYSLYTGKENAR